MLPLVGFALRTLHRIHHRRMASRVDRVPVDPRIRFPCYRSLDDFIDVAGFQRLCPMIEDEIKRRIGEDRDYMFDAGPYRLGNLPQKDKTACVIALTNSSQAYQYFNLNRADLWTPTPEAASFQPLMDWIARLPMREIARVMLIFEQSGQGAAPHRDHCNTDVCHEFIWLRSPTKRFFCLDQRTGVRKMITSHSAWFDTVHQYHGTDQHNELSFSLRIDGSFSDAIRSQIPVNRFSPASTASLWASLADATQC